MNSGTQHVACVAIGCFAACAFIKQDTRVLFELSVLYIDKTKLKMATDSFILHLLVPSCSVPRTTVRRTRYDTAIPDTSSGTGSRKCIVFFHIGVQVRYGQCGCGSTCIVCNWLRVAIHEHLFPSWITVIFQVISIPPPRSVTLFVVPYPNITDT